MNRPASVNSRRCEKCAVGYITVDVYEEALCLNCGSRPRGWTLVETRKYADNRHAVPGERWVTSPGNPDLKEIRLPIHFEASSYATTRQDGRTELHPLPERRKLMVLTYLQESFSDRRLRHAYTPVWVRTRKHDVDFEWRAYPVISLVAQFERAFELEKGDPLSHVEEFFMSEREEWLKSLRVSNTPPPE